MTHTENTLLTETPTAPVSEDIPDKTKQKSDEQERSIKGTESNQIQVTTHWISKCHWQYQVNPQQQSGLRPLP